MCYTLYNKCQPVFFYASRKDYAMMQTITLSDGEWKLMKLLWRYAPMTLRMLVDHLAPETDWSTATIFMMLKRLVAKGAIALDDTRKPQTYYPILSRRDIATTETDAFLDRVFDGNIETMVASLSSRHVLTGNNIAELRKILDRTEEALVRKQNESAH